MIDRFTIFRRRRDCSRFVTEPANASTPASVIQSGTLEAITRRFFAPASRNCRTRCVPRKPVPPVIKIFFSAFLPMFLFSSLPLNFNIEMNQNRSFDFLQFFQTNLAEFLLNSLLINRANLGYISPLNRLSNFLRLWRGKPQTGKLLRLTKLSAQSKQYRQTDC